MTHAYSMGRKLTWREIICGSLAYAAIFAVLFGAAYLSFSFLGVGQ